MSGTGVWQRGRLSTGFDVAAGNLTVDVISTVVSQHAEEAALLWLRRNRAVHEPHYSLSDLATLDDRLCAHFDGLLIAGQAGWDACREELDWLEADGVFAATVVAFESGDSEWIRQATEVGISSDELADGLIAAAGWLPWNRVAEPVSSWLASKLPRLRRVGITSSAIHRRDPGPALGSSLADPDPLLRARALRAVGELARSDLYDRVRRELASDSPACRFAAAWTTALRAPDERALDVLRRIAETTGPHRGRALQLVVRRIKPPDARRWMDKLATGTPDQQRAAVIGTGALGDAERIPWLIDQMHVPALARVAGEAVSVITGVNIAYQDLEGEWPDGYEAGPTEDPDDDNVELDPDENLPWPDARLIASWWQSRADQFPAGERLLLGKRPSDSWLQKVLRDGLQRQRAAAALELAIGHPHRPLFEVRAPGYRQQELLRIE